MSSNNLLHVGDDPVDRLPTDTKHRADLGRGVLSLAMKPEDLDDDIPARQLRLGFDTRGRLLETVVLVFDSGNELVMHAMKARPQMLDLLP